MLRMRLLGLIAAALLLFAAPASATVVTFDDLSGVGTLADGYGGINWGGVWTYYDLTDPPYNPVSGLERTYAYPTINGSFSFQHEAVFSGAYFAGYGSTNSPDSTGSGPLSFELFLHGSLVGVSSGSLDLSGAPAFLASAYAGLVDTVVIIAPQSYYVMDDVTYTSAVPLPAALPLFAAAMAGFGFVSRRRAKRQQI